MRRILLDCDGVLADLTAATVPFLKVFGVQEPVTRYDFGLDAAGKEYMHALWSTPGFQSLIQPTQAAAEIIYAARTTGRVYVVTASHEAAPTWESERRRWLKRHLGIESRRVLFVPSGAKYTVTGDVFIDDHYPNVVAWAKANPLGEALLMEQPWSEIGVELPQNVWVVQPNEVADALRHLAGFKPLSSPIASPVTRPAPITAPIVSQNTGLSSIVG